MVSFVLRIGVRFFPPLSVCPLAAVIQGLLARPVGADREHGNDALELLPFARRAGRRLGISRQQQELELMSAAATFVLVNGHI